MEMTLRRLGFNYIGPVLKNLVLLLVCYWIRSELCIAVILNWLFYDDPN